MDYLKKNVIIESQNVDKGAFPHEKSEKNGQRPKVNISQKNIIAPLNI